MGDPRVCCDKPNGGPTTLRGTGPRCEQRRSLDHVQLEMQEPSQPSSAVICLSKCLASMLDALGWGQADGFKGVCHTLA